MLKIEQGHPSKLLHRETTDKIIGAAYEVYRELGYGFLERVYQRALQFELIQRGASAEIEKKIQVRYKTIIAGDYEADLVVDDRVVVEIKVASDYNKRDEAQLLNELRATGTKVGLLVNFGRTKVEYKRFVY